MIPGLYPQNTWCSRSGVGSENLHSQHVPQMMLEPTFENHYADIKNSVVGDCISVWENTRALLQNEKGGLRTQSGRCSQYARNRSRERTVCVERKTVRTRPRAEAGCSGDRGGLRGRQARVRIPALLLLGECKWPRTNYTVALSFPFLICKMGIIIVLAYRVVVRTKWDCVCEKLKRNGWYVS